MDSQRPHSDSLDVRVPDGEVIHNQVPGHDVSNSPRPSRMGAAGSIAAGTARPLFDLELEARLQFGSREMCLQDLLELGAGDVVELDRNVSDPVDLIIGDRIVARGEVVVVAGNFALSITEVLAPVPRLESVRCLP